MTEDIQKARRMTIRLFALGERTGCTAGGELAQLLASNAFGQKDRANNLIKLSLETSESKTSSAPLNHAFRLFLAARNELSRPFNSRSDCLQSCIYDALLCYMSFWGLVFEYYETMYYKPVDLPDGTVESSPATVSFEAGWKITCLFIRDTMLSTAARAAGLSSGYDRSVSWYFYPANASSELEEAKMLVLTVIGKIRKRGTVLVAGEGMIGHISFSHTMPLVHWVEDKLDKDWNNNAKLDSLCEEYYESSSIRLNVNVNPLNDEASEESLNASFLDGFEPLVGDDAATNPYSLLSMTSRSICLNIRPITPAVLGSHECEWNGVDMGEFCREVFDQCSWPEVVNTVSTAGQIGISLLNMTGDVSTAPRRRRSSLSAPSRLSLSPEQQAILPFQTTPSNGMMPNLEPIGIPKFGDDFIPIHIPQLTPTPTGNGEGFPALTPTPIKRYHRTSDVTFYGGDSPPPSAGKALVPIPSEIEAEYESPRKIQRVSSHPSMVEAMSPVRKTHAAGGVQLSQIVDCIVNAAKRELTAKDWSLEASLGDILRKGKTLSALYSFVLMSSSMDKNSDSQNQQTNAGGRGGKRRRSSSVDGQSAGTKRVLLPTVAEASLEAAENYLSLFMDVSERHALRPLSPEERAQFRCLARILSLAQICEEQTLSTDSMKMAVIVAGDITCFCTNRSPTIPDSDIYAAGLRGIYADARISAIEVGKHLGFSDWLSLGTFFNDFAYTVLLGNSGLLTPNITQSAPVRRGAANNTSKITRNIALREGLTEHCLLVCSELVNRWSFTHCSSFWTMLRQLEEEFVQRRHGVESALLNARTSSVDKLEAFLKNCLISAGLCLVDLGDRLNVSCGIMHAAFDIIRCTVLLRPYLLRGRHMNQIVMCSLMAASMLFSPPDSRLDFTRLSQAALLMQSDRDAEKIVSRFVLKTVLLSTCGGDVLFSDGSAALALPGMHQAETELTGHIQEFYEKEFVSEMRQVLLNLHRSKPGSRVELGPYPDKHSKDPSISPLSYMALSSSLALGMQIGFGVARAETKTLPASNFPNALAFTCPLGVVPSLVPPLEPHESASSSNRKDRFFRWVNGFTIWARDNGVYSVISDNGMH